MEQMLTDAFMKLLNLSISACWLIAAVLLLRLVFKKAPGWISCLLWAIVGVRLVLPFSFESVLSLIPSAETVPPEILYDTTPQIYSGITTFNSVVNPIIGEALAPSQGASVNPVQIITIIGAYLWAFGAAVLCAYALISYLSLKRRVAAATRLTDNVFQSEAVNSPFVLGIIKPKIYLSYNIAEGEADYVISHEKAHIKRGDHLIKPLAYLLLCVHWFNPLVWLAYALLCRDIEMACDEKVIRELDEKGRRDYSEALLSCSINRRKIAACPIAFGEVGVKERIKGVMNYKKPAFWVIAVAILSCIITAVCFLTNPVRDVQLFGAAYDKGTVVYTHMDASYLTSVEYYEISEKGDLWQIKEDGEQTWSGVLVESDMTKEKLFGYIPEEKQKDVSIGRIKRSYELKSEGVIDEGSDVKNLFLVTSDGKIYQAMIMNAGEEEVLMTLLRHEKTDRELLTELDGFSTVIDTVTADIDSDGKKENCVLTYGPTSGLYTVVFTATEVGSEKAEYINTFNLMYTGGTEFHVTSDGKVQIKCGNTIWQNGETVKTEDVYLNIKIEDGNIALYDGESMVSYWGEQGIKPSEFLKKINALENAVSEAVLNKHYTKGNDNIPFESHEILFSIKDEEKNTVTVYALIHYEEFSYKLGEITSEGAMGMQVEVKFKGYDTDGYELKKYRVLGKDDDIENYLPDDYEYNDAEIAEDLQKQTLEKAVRHFGKDYVDGQLEYAVVDFLLKYSDERVDTISADMVKTVDATDDYFDLWDSDGSSVFSTERKDFSEVSAEEIITKLKIAHNGKNIDTSFLSSDSLEAVFYIDEETDEVRYTAYYQDFMPVLLVEGDFSEVYAVVPLTELVTDEVAVGEVKKSLTYTMRVENKDKSDLTLPKLHLVEGENRNTFVLTYDLLSSYMICGDYKIKGKTLKATQDSGETYIFRINNDETLSFNGKKSSPLPALTDEGFGCEIADGDVFVLSAQSEV